MDQDYNIVPAKRVALEGEVIQPGDEYSSIWRNRILGHEMVDPRTLAANPRNFRVHSALQREVVTGSIEEMGWIDEVTVNKYTDFVLDGHLRVGIALRRMAEDGFPDSPADDTKQQITLAVQYYVPVKYVDLTEEEEALAIILFDQTTNMAGIDRDILNDVVAEVEVKREAVKKFIDDLVSGARQTAAEVVADAPKPEAEPDMVVDLDAECSVEILCSMRDLEEFQPILRKWGRKPTVTVNFNTPGDEDEE